MRVYLFIIAFFVSLSSFCQETEVDFDAIDSLYREDQFYINITYNSIQKPPHGLTQNKFAPGICLGFLRDIPVNKSRTISVAPGFGFSYSLYNQNLKISSNIGVNSYHVFGAGESYSKDKLSLYTVDLPIEFRWRNSTPESHKFWRIYSGFKMSYLFYDHYKLVTPMEVTKISNNKDLNQFQYGVYLTAGWNTWNLYVYYGLNPIFKSSATIDNKSIDMNTANFGLMFYIL